MPSKNAHITIGGEPLCLEHSHLITHDMHTVSGRIITCDYRGVNKARRVAKYLRRKLTYPVNTTIRVVAGACPFAKKGE